MEYMGIKIEKEIMTISEMAKLGFSEELLLNYCRSKNSHAFKEGSKRNSPWKVVVRKYIDYINSPQRRRAWR